MYTNSIENASPNITLEWFAFRVRPRHEKKVALQLREEQNQCFLPLTREARRWANRQTHVDLPLLPGYVFCRSHRFGLLPILKTPGVIDVIRVARSPVPIPDEEINALERAINASILIDPCPFVATGQLVTIHSGPLSGVSGIVTDRRNAKQLVLSITLLRRSVLVHVDLSSVCTTGLNLMRSERTEVA
jgi:transcription antitermination factor NusG